MNHQVTNFILATVLMGCTSSVHQTYQSNYVYSPTLTTEAYTETHKDAPTQVKPGAKPVKAITITLCATAPENKAIPLPPLVDYGKLSFRSHREALQAMATQIAEMRKLIRDHNENKVKSLGCKPYKVLVE